MNSGIGLSVALAATSGFLDALSRNSIKASNVAPLFFSGLGFLFALIVYAVWLSFAGIPEIEPRFWPLVGIHMPMLVAAMILTVRAHREGSMINTAPYIALTPAFLLVTGPLLGTGRLSFYGAIGVLVLVAGLYLINLRDGKGSIFDPIKNIWKERAPKFMVIVAAIFAVSSNLDYLCVESSSAPFYLLVDHGGVAVVCITLGLISKKYSPENYENGAVKRQIWLLAMFGLFVGLSAALHMLAFKYTGVVAYVIASKRTGVIVFSILVAALLAYAPSMKERFGKEKLRLKTALPGVFLVIVGMILIIFN